MALKTDLFYYTSASREESPWLLRQCLTLLAVLLLSLFFYFPLGCAVSASSSVGSSQQSSQAATSTGMVRPEFFGMVVKSVAHVPSVETGSRRLWDCGVTWAAVEPVQGSFRWATLDAEVAAAQAAGAEVTLTLGMTPTWASSQPTSPSTYGAGATAMPAQMADWDAYVRAVATRYQGRIQAYEVWNAPSDPLYWSGAPAQVGTDMATLSAHVAAVVRAVDSQATIVSPALKASDLQQFLSAGGSSSVDAVGVAVSLAGQAPEVVPAGVGAIRSVLEGTSAETKPLWNDQPSWTLGRAGPSAADQAGYVARALVLNAAYGVSRVAWYAWDENVDAALRLTDTNGQPTAAGLAYGVMEGWLSGATINGCSSTAEQVWMCQVVRGGRPAWIVWSAGAAVQASAMGMLTVTDLGGTEQAVGVSGSVLVGGSPMLLQ
ncbi:MAG TPA: endo-1,4-beta-xylanase [Acidobacteriaceae bacterium]